MSFVHMKRVAVALAPALVACLATIGCGGDGGSSSNYSGDPQPPTQNAAPPSQNVGSSSGQASQTQPGPNAQQAIQEADIIELQDGHLFAISKSGTLSIIDVSKPGQLALSSQIMLPGEPFEMYLNGSRLVLLMNNAKIDTTTASAAVLVLNIADPVLVQRIGTFPVTGSISDSRLQGDILYLVTDASVTSFDLTTPSSLHQVAQLPLDSGKHSIIFGNGRMYVGGQAGIDLVDVSDAKGKLEKGVHVTTAGAINERWQMSEKDSVLRVVSQAGSANPTVETFTVWNARSMQAMAKTEIQIPSREQLKSVRFDEDRAYFITFRQTDPLYIVDLTDPMKPQQRGQLTMPGFVVHLEPRGNRLLGLGVDTTNYEGRINVSLFDVSNLDAPRMIQRVNFGQYSTNLAEDQDRLQKAFRIGTDGLITVPYSGAVGTSCETGGAIQLVKMDNDTLYKGQSLPMAGNPRRALVNQNELVAVSDSNVSAFDIATATKTADITIGKCEVRTTDVTGNTTVTPPTQGPDYYPGNRYYDDYGSDDDKPFACSSTRRGGSTSWTGMGLGLALVVGSIARRRASRRDA
jgi:uncharacterized secreted protein with C-terminal beta-propeller domain